VKGMPSERNDDSGEGPVRSDPSVSHLRWAVDIGVPFVPGSIRAHVDGEPVEVVEESAEAVSSFRLTSRKARPSSSTTTPRCFGLVPCRPG